MSPSPGEGSDPRRLVVAMTGASGAIYGLRLVERLGEAGIGVDLVVSAAARRVLRLEVDPGHDPEAHGPEALPLRNTAHVRFFDPGDVGAPMASGTALRRGMVIAPCSMGTLGRVAAGTSEDLIGRAADVCLKERRPLVLVVRETPLSLIHIRAMETVTLAGATVLPASPGFYHRPASIDDLVDHVVMKIFDVLRIDNSLVRRWAGG